MIRDHISFFTKIPTGKRGGLEKIANTQYLFPILGLIIGLIVYLAGLGLSYTSLSSDLMAVFLVVFLYLVTGIIHLDGVSDFFDGLVSSGDVEDRVRVMKDPDLGMGGALASFLVILILFAEFKYLFSTGMVFEPLVFSWFNFGVPLGSLFVGLVIGEVSAKLGMITCIFFSDPLDEGMGKFFLDRISISDFLLGLVFSVLVFGLLGSFFVVVLVCQLVPLVLIQISTRNFGGVNGDVIGASNELTRITAILTTIILL